MGPGGLGVSIAVVLRVAAGVGDIRGGRGGYQRAIPCPPRVTLRAHRSARYAVSAPAQSHNLQLACVKLRKLDSSLLRKNALFKPLGAGLSTASPIESREARAFH